MKKLSVVIKQLLSSALTFVTLMAPLQVNQSHTEAGDDPSQRVNVSNLPIASTSSNASRKRSFKARTGEGAGESHQKMARADDLKAQNDLERCYNTIYYK